MTDPAPGAATHATAGSAPGAATGGAAAGRPAYALEITGKGIGQIADAAHLLPAGAPVNIAFLGNEAHAQRVAAGRALRRHGLDPVPIMSSRRFRSEADRDELFAAHAAASAPTRFLFVGGDPDRPAGPYEDSVALLRTDVLARHGVRRAGVVGYPDGHPKFSASAHWRALTWKVARLADAGCDVEITTQYGLDPDTVIAWLERLRAAGIDAPVRVGVPGPARATTLVRYAGMFGLELPADVRARYGLDPDRPDAVVTADRFWDRLHERLDAARAAGSPGLGPVLAHLYPFGGVARGAAWLNARLAG